MSNRSGQRSTGAVSRVPGSYRTLTGGCFHPQRNQCIELPRLLPEDLKVLQAATKPLQLLFPHLEWEEWGVELVEGHDRLVEILPQEKTIIIDRHGQGELALLSWDLFGAFFHMILTTEYDHWLPAEEAQQYAFVAQLRWFLQESPDWQYEIIASLALPGMDTLDLAGLLWSILPETRSSKLEILLRDQALPRPRWSALDPQEACWHAAVDYLERQTSQPMSTPQAHPSATPVPETMAPVPPARLDKLRHALSVC